MKRITKVIIVLAALALAVPVLGVVALVAFWPGPYERHFASPVPPTAELLHYARRTSGFEVKYVFVFRFSDDKLLTQLVKDWSLTRASVPATEPISTVALSPPAWWLNREGLKALPERYGWVHLTKQRYRSVWVDRAAGKLYAEYGRW